MKESYAAGGSEDRSPLRRLIAVAAAVFTGLALVLFLVSSLFGGFRMNTPLGLLSCRDPARLLLLTLAGLLLWTVLDSGRGEDVPPEERKKSERNSSAGPVSVFLLVTFLLWVRFVYRAYEPCFGGRPVSYDLLRLVHALFLFSGLTALAGWKRMSGSGREIAAFFAALFLALSPLRFYVSSFVVTGFAMLAVFLVFQSPIEVWLRRVCGGRTWLGCVIALAVLIGGASHFTGLGWAGNRLQEHFFQRVAPGLSVWLLPLGGWNLWCFRAGPSPGWRLSLALGLWGLVLSGSRGEVGALGALLMLPLVSALMEQGVSFLWKWPLGRTVFGRNVMVLCLLGVLLGLVRDGLDRGIRSPYTPRSEASVPGEDLDRHEGAAPEESLL